MSKICAICGEEGLDNQDFCKYLECSGPLVPKEKIIETKQNKVKLINIRLCPVKRLNQNGTEIIMDFNDGMHHMVYMDIPLKASEVSRALSALSDRIADFYIKEQDNDN